MATDSVLQAAVREEAALGYQWLRRPRRLLALLDGLAAACALLALLALDDWRPMSVAAGHTALIGIALILLLTMVLGFRNGQYTNSRRLSRFGDPGKFGYHLFVSACVVALVALVTKGFFTGSLEASRLVIVLTLMIFLVIGVVSRVSLAVRQRAQFMSGAAFRRVLVLGSGQASRDFIHFLTKRPWLGVACAGRLDYCPALDAGQWSGDGRGSVGISATLRGFENLDRAWVNSGASEVVVALDPDEYPLLPEVTKLLSLAHVRFSVVPTLFEGSYHSATTMGYGELPVIDVDVDPLDRVERAFKRGLDLTVCGALLLVTGLPLALLMLAIKADSRGPIFYMQPRIGHNGRKFLMYKFRTMVVDADNMVDGLQDQNDKSDNGQLFKIKDDPRTTRVGRFLRKWSADELPQVINVWKGDMSLVGPRPPLAREVENYSAEHYTRLRGLPGITGLWQVSGRSDLTFDEMVKLDKFYLDNWSLKLDLSILLKTVLVVLARKGAY